MKKTYSKPDIVFENFSLSTSVSLNCQITPIDPDVSPSGPGGISVEAGMFVVFQNTTQGCNWIQENGKWNDFCYHNPSEFNMLFVS